MNKSFGLTARISLALATILCGLFFVACDTLSVTPPDDKTPSVVVPPGAIQSVPFYLGLGYDVINSSYINRSDVKVTQPILDQKKMLADSIIISEVASIEFSTSSGEINNDANS
jgi:hypothetical protein